MSHFTVLIIGENVEDQLEPFWELDLSQKEAEEDPRAVFNDITEEELEKYNTKSVKKVIMPDGRMLFPWDDEIKCKDGCIPNNPDLEQRDVPFNELYKTFEEYMLDFCGKTPNENGRFGYYYNPNAKWDWWVVGGRWSGYFKLKEGTEGLVGDPVYGDGKAKDGYVDQSFKKNIDFDGMVEDQIIEGTEKYDKFHSIVNGREIPKWEKILVDCENDEEKTREIYNKDEVIKDLRNAGYFFNLETFCISKEEYLKKVSYDAISTYAVVYNGEWYEKGEMGWWGISSNEKDPDKWNEEFNKLLESVSDDTLLTIVDCHI